MKLEFRDLKAEEIDVRIAMCNASGISLLLYKDARVDQDILDESVGAMNWQRHHTRDNANCIVAIWDEDKKQWIEKEDTGKESFTEKEKGLASDSFKRACFNWGIGRELYTSPFIWVSSKDCNIENKNGKNACKDSFKVSHIKIENKKIVELNIKNTKRNKVVFSYPISSGEFEQEPQLTYREQLIQFCKEKNLDMQEIAEAYSLGKTSDEVDYHKTLIALKKMRLDAEKSAVEMKEKMGGK